MIKFSRSTNYPGGKKVLYVLQFTYISVRSGRPDRQAVKQFTENKRVD